LRVARSPDRFEAISHPSFLLSIGRAGAQGAACRHARPPFLSPSPGAKRYSSFPFFGLGFTGETMTSKDGRLTLALYQPDIAQNAGAMLRSCACFGAAAAIIGPTGFPSSDRHFRRAGMDYLNHVTIERHDSWRAFEEWRQGASRRLVLLTTKAPIANWDFAFAAGDVILVGRESAGVPDEVHKAADARVRIPIRSETRSLNVSVAAGIALSEAIRRIGPVEEQGLQ
jgi:tRNA (cytidine/uridine-2'-O-)-methyltransferase